MRKTMGFHLVRICFSSKWHECGGGGLTRKFRRTRLQILIPKEGRLVQTHLNEPRSGRPGGRPLTSHGGGSEARDVPPRGEQGPGVRHPLEKVSLWETRRQLNGRVKVFELRDNWIALSHLFSRLPCWTRRHASTLAK